MKKKAMTPKVPIRRVPRPIIALAAAPNIRTPNIGWERKLKGGELSWALDGNVTERMVQKSVAVAKMMITEAVGLEIYERTLRADLSAQLQASIDKVKTEKAAGQ